MEMLTVREASEESGLTPQTLRYYCNKGVFPNAIKMRGTRWLIPDIDLEKLMNNEIDLTGIFSKKIKEK